MRSWTTVDLKPPSLAPTVQRVDETPTPEPAAAVVSAPTAPTAPTAPAAPAAPAAAPAPASAAELDEMAKRLYEPLSARLRAELWLDRERAGLVTERHR